MVRSFHLSERARARFLRIGPDRFWLCHCVVLALVLGLLVMMHDVNGQIIAATGPELAASLWRRQAIILVAAAIVLVAGIAITIVPSRLIVQSHMHALRSQTKRLQESKTQLETANRQLLHMTNHDHLTGLPNRRRLVTVMTDMFAHGRNADHSFLLIGLDGFKSINDSTGHDIGDELLVAVSRALRCCVDDHQIVARIGGDEFGLLTDEPPAQMLQRVQAALADGFDVQGRQLKTNTSIGYLGLGDAQGGPQAILANAAMALQVAKANGGRRAQRFTPELRETAGQLLLLQMEMPDAIRNGEFEPWFQPQVRLTDGGLHGVEVLARWRHPTRGLLTPDSFLPVAERAGMMIEMDHAIWKSAMGHAVNWQNSQIWHPVISLNAAPETISDPDLIERFLLSLRRSGLTADQIIMEVLETTLIDGADDMAAINIDSLAECGIALELDDFGTGYASLCRLTQLPLSGIKLDKSLVAPLPDQGADSVVRAILALAAELGLHVIAEGIEDIEQARHLSDRGCKIGQGYGFARPMPAKEFERWLALHAKGPITMDDAPLPMVKQA